MRSILPLILAFSFSAHALETDNYLLWGRALPDSGDDLNHFFETRINEALTSAASCPDFASTRRRYFEEYIKKIKHGYSPADAEKFVIRFGLYNEATILGLWPTGVFSYGDMEACEEVRHPEIRHSLLG